MLLDLVTRTTYESDRGLVRVVACPPGYEDRRAELVGQTVTIDGALLVVAGVESYAIPRLVPGTPIGLLCHPA